MPGLLEERLPACLLWMCPRGPLVEACQGTEADGGSQADRRGWLLQRGCEERGQTPLDPHPRGRGEHTGPQAPNSRASPPVILMRLMLFYEPPRVGEPGEGGVSAPSPGPSPSQGSHAALLPHCLDSVYAASSRKSSRCSLTAQLPPLNSLGRQRSSCHPGPRHTTQPD